MLKELDLTTSEYPMITLGVDEQDQAKWNVRGRPLLMVAETGLGKTTTARAVAAQFAQAGGVVFIRESKRTAYEQAFAHLPNVRICSTQRDMTLALGLLKSEIERRRHLIEQYNDRAVAQELPDMTTHPEMYFRPMLLLDDDAVTYLRLKPHPDGKATKEGEARLDDYGLVMTQGPGVAVATAMFASRLLRRFPLPPALYREFGPRLIAGTTTKPVSWRVVFPDGDRRREPLPVGRAMFNDSPAGQPHEVHLGSVSDRNARIAAMRGEMEGKRQDAGRAYLLATVTGLQVGEVLPGPMWLDEK